MSGTTDIKASALELIGNTPLVALDRIWPGPGRILAKCEFMNPGKLYNIYFFKSKKISYFQRN